MSARPVLLSFGNIKVSLNLEVIGGESNILIFIITLIPKSSSFKNAILCHRPIKVTDGWRWVNYSYCFLFRLGVSSPDEFYHTSTADSQPHLWGQEEEHVKVDQIARQPSLCTLYTYDLQFSSSLSSSRSGYLHNLLQRSRAQTQITRRHSPLLHL